MEIENLYMYRKQHSNLESKLQLRTIVYLVNSLRKAGPVNVLYDIISHLDQSHYRVYIVKFLEDDLERSITARFKELGVKVISLSCSFIRLELCTKSIAKQVNNLMRKIQPDVIHTHGYHPVLVASYLREWKRIETLHCVCQEDFIFSKGRIVGGYMIRRYLRALRKMDHCAAISHTVKRAYLPILGERKITVVYNGCDIRQFSPLSQEQIIQKKRELNIPEGCRIYVIVGALSVRKNPLIVVQSFIELYFQKQLSEPTLVLFFGIGDLMKECMQMAQEYPFIQFKGYQMNVAEYMQIADYSICASRSEGFGLNYVESLMVNVPVIGSDIQPFQEFTEMLPALQVLQFKVDDKEGLKQAIVKSQQLQLDKAVLGEMARKTFSAQNMSDGYVQLYEQFWH
jgi:glycosyltransferase involved in cell wall biosynthesis